MPPLAVAISLMYWGCNPAGSFQPRETVRGRPPYISGSKSSTSTPTGMRSLPEDASAGEAVSDRLSTIANPSLDATADRRMPPIRSRPSLHLGTVRSYGNFAYMSTRDPGALSSCCAARALRTAEVRATLSHCWERGGG